MLLEQGRVTTLKSWFDVLPPQVQDASPWMALWHGIALSPFAALQARARFEAAHARFGEAEPMGRILAIGAVLATHYLEFDHGQVEEWIDLLLPQLRRRAAVSRGRPPNCASMPHWLFALSFARPRAELTEACVARLRTLLQRDDIPANARVDAATLMLAYHQINGEFDESERIVAMAAPWVADPNAYAELSRAVAAATRAFPDKQGNDAEALKIYDQSQAIGERERVDAAAAAHLCAPRACDRRAVRRRCGHRRSRARARGSVLDLRAQARSRTGWCDPHLDRDPAPRI